MSKKKEKKNLLPQGKLKQKNFKTNNNMNRWKRKSPVDTHTQTHVL